MWGGNWSRKCNNVCYVTEHIALWRILYFDSSLTPFPTRLTLLCSRFTSRITTLILKQVLINKYQPLAGFPLLSPVMSWNAQDVFCHSEVPIAAWIIILQTLGSVSKGSHSLVGKYSVFTKYHLGISLVLGSAHQGFLTGFQADSDEAFWMSIHFHSQVNLAKLCWQVFASLIFLLLLKNT